MAGNGGESRWSVSVWVTAALLLPLRLLAMQVRNEVNWDETISRSSEPCWPSLLARCELAPRMTGNSAYRTGGIAVAAAFILVWMNLADGVIGTEDNPLNLLYA